MGTKAVTLVMLFLLVGGLNQVSYGDQLIRQYADWMLFESRDGKSCFVTTNNSTWSESGMTSPTVHLQLWKIKNSISHPVEVKVHFAANFNPASGAIVQQGSLSLNTFDITGQKQSYWGVSSQLSALLEAMKVGSGVLGVKSSGRGVLNRLSLQGFSDILKVMESHCNQGLPLVDQKFENNFFVGINPVIEFSKMDVMRTTQLRNLYFEAYSAFQQIQNANLELQKIIDRYQPFLDEQKNNELLTSRTKNELLPYQEQVLNQAIVQQQKLRQDIKKFEQQIVNLKEIVKRSQVNLNQKKDIIAPFEPPFNEITKKFYQAQGELDQNQARYDWLEARVIETESKIANLNKEWSNLENGLISKQRQVDMFYQTFLEAQQRRQRFNSEAEYRDILNQDRQYRDAVHQFQDLERKIVPLKHNKNQRQQEIEHLRREVNQCRNQVAQPDQPRPDRPHKETIILSQANCQRLESRLSTLNNELSQVELELQRLSDQQYELNRKIRRVEDFARRRVNEQQSRLDRDESVAYQNYAEAQRGVQQDLNRIELISRSELPRANQELQSFRQERPVVQQSIKESQMQVKRINEELVRFKKASDWDIKYANLVKAQAQYDQDSRNLDQENLKLSQAERGLAGAISTEKTASAQIESLKQQLVQLAARAIVLAERLSQLPAERAEFDLHIEQQKNIFESKRLSFKSLV